MVLCFGALALGLTMGEYVARRVEADHARRLAIALALGGALFTIVKGVVAW